MVKTLKPGLAMLDMRVAAIPPKQADAVYQTALHREWARAVIERDGGRCQWPGCDKAAPAHRMVADHIVEVKDGGARFDIDNGQCLCIQHNTLKGSRARMARTAQRPGGGSDL
jgi:hypothetical protein